jgi:hypothetical protein
MRALLGTGLALLAISLLLSVALTGAAPLSGGLRTYTAASWLATAALYVGAGLTVGGAVLRALLRETRQDERPAPGRDWYAED